MNKVLSVESGYPIEMEHVFIDPEEAEMMLELYDYEAQRAVRDTNLTFLVDEMKGGKFLPFSMITIVVDEKVGWLTDGRHRLLSVIESGEGQWFWVQTIAKAQPADVYVVQDAGASRTMMNFVLALGTMDGVDIPVLSKPSALAAARQLSQSYILSNSVPKHSARQVDAMFLEWLPYIKLYGASLLGGTMATHMRSSVFIASGAMTFRHCPQEASEFWTGIAQDDGLSRYDPRKRVVDMLWDGESLIRNNFGGNAIKTFRILAYHWNKFLKKEEVKRAPNQYPADFVFDGTGWGSWSGVKNDE